MNSIFNNSPVNTSLNGVASIAKSAAIAAGVLVCVATSGTAFAGERYSLAYSPDNIGSPEEMAQLHEQVRSVANQACPSYSETRSFKLRAACRREVEDQLIAKINLPAFSAYVDQANGPARPAFVAGVSAH